jgi:predicted O-methyltransferase YrrM
MILPEKIETYIEAHTTPLNNTFYALERDTHLKTLDPKMISGAYQGEFLRMISLMLRPRRILEIGTYTGYASLCLAAGLMEDGILHTIEVNKELSYITRKHIALAGLEGKIILHEGKGEEIAPTLNEIFDLVFIDAGKNDNAAHYEMSLGMTRQGGIMLIDNVLWKGKVIADAPDAKTKAVIAFNQLVQDDPRTENVLLPIRDGLMMVRKK